MGVQIRCTLANVKIYEIVLKTERKGILMIYEWIDLEREREKKCLRKVLGNTKIKKD